MEKPISVKIEEFCNGIAALLNNAELPFYILEPYVMNTCKQVSEAAEKQRRSEKMQYQNYLQEVEKNGNAESTHPN
jgi:hypothetical protein